MISAPSPAVPNGERDANGRFTPGNRAGRGNPHAQHVGRLRSVLLDAVTEDDMRAVAMKLIGMAKAGDLAAIKELLNRTLGKPQEADLIERLEQVEASLAPERTRP